MLCVILECFVLFFLGLGPSAVRCIREFVLHTALYCVSLGQLLICVVLGIFGVILMSLN